MSELVLKSTSTTNPRINHIYGTSDRYENIISYLNDSSWYIPAHNSLFAYSNDKAYKIKLDDSGINYTLSIYNEKENIIAIENNLCYIYFNNAPSDKTLLEHLPYDKFTDYLSELEDSNGLKMKDTIIKRYVSLIDNNFAKELYALTNTVACGFTNISGTNCYKLEKITPFIRIDDLSVNSKSAPLSSRNVKAFIVMRGIPVAMKHTYLTNGVHIFQYPQYLIGEYAEVYDSIDYMYVELPDNNFKCYASTKDIYSKEENSDGLEFGLNTIK